mgnify:CR=1 FL=1
MTGEPLVRVRGLTKRYGDQTVLRGLDLDVAAGQRIALLGPNGAGKTTLFRCLLGIVGFGGEVRVAGHDVMDRGEAARRAVGYVPQQAPAYRMSLEEFLELFSDLRGVEPARAARRLADLGLTLEEAGRKSMRALSGGMMQKAVLALSLASGAPLLLLDEPTASLDPGSRREFLRAVRSVGEERTMLFASHRFDEIETLADRVLVLHRSRFVFDGTPDELRERAGMGALLWLRVPTGAIGEARRWLAGRPAVQEARRDGAGVEAEVEPASVPGLVAGLRDGGFEVLEVRTRPPAPDAMMDRILAEEDPSSAGTDDGEEAGKGTGGRAA